jgi:hypothetical protein
MAVMQMANDPDAKSILTKGQATTATLSNRTLMLGRDAECHWNASQLLKSGNIDRIAIGYAKNPEVGWHQHTWGIKGNHIVETEAGNTSATHYFGETLSPKESRQFADFALKNPPGGGKVRAGNVQRAWKT